MIHPVLYGLGVDQNWNVFAPDPRRNVLDLEARVKYADGSSDVWHVPRGNALIGTYWDYRWGKWMEYAAQNSNPVLWAPVAEYVARRRRDRNPVFVTLVRRWYTLPPPGEVRTRPRWHSYAFYRFPVTNQLLAKWAGE